MMRTVIMWYVLHKMKRQYDENSNNVVCPTQDEEAV